MSPRTPLSLSLAAALLFLAAPAAGQVALPGAAQVPQAQQRFKRPTPPQSAQPGETPAPPDIQAPPPGAETVRFVLRTVEFEGMTRYTPADLAPLYAGLVGREVSLADLYRLAVQVTDRYRRDGYMLSVAIVPRQDIEAGAVRIQVVEGFVSKTRFNGPLDDPGTLPENLAARITTSRPLRTADLERDVLLIGDLPGVNVQSVLSPSLDAFGGADLELVVQQTPWEGFVSLDNQGSRYLGPYALSAGWSEYSRFGGHEQIDLTGAIDPFDNTMAYVQGAVMVPVHHAGRLMGDTLQLSGLYSRAKPDLPDEVFPFQTRSENVEGRLTYFVPVIRGRQRNLSARLAFIWRDLENRITDLPTDPFNPQEEHVRVLQPRLTYDSVDRFQGVSILDVAANIGLGAFGASRNADPRLVRYNADGQFFYLAGMAARLQPVADRASILARVDFQVSDQPMPTTERFGVGGPRAGTGYPPGAITGDSGLSLRLEGRYGRELSSRTITSYQAYLHYDYGFASDQTPGPDDWNALSTIGLGVRLNLFKALAFNPEITHQLSGSPADCSDCRHETRLLFSLTQRF